MPESLFSLISLPFLTAFLVTVITTPLTIILARKFGLMDDPKRHIHPGMIHNVPIPRAGGIPLYVGCLVAGIVFLPLNAVTIAIFFAGFIALVIGLIDDKLNASAKDISPYLRFLTNILCAVIVVGSGVSISFITNPLGGIFHFDTLQIPVLSSLPFSIAEIISMLWIIWVMNMLNWSKGVDGQMPGIVAISAIFIGLLSLRFPIITPDILIDAQLSFIIAGAAIGFLLFNFHPARIFPGYGATAIYLFLAVVSILSSAKLATAILVMGVPIVDALYTIIRRVANKKSPFFGDKKHLHHILLKLGLSQRQIALLYWSISAILGTVSLVLQSRSKAFAIIMLIVIVGMGLSFLHFITKEVHEEETS
jgi:UDP-GlcNAc:undecaprenyl-phosphate/decaprenyl-phosphate GlcNAc-1-phosphate transferase